MVGTSVRRVVLSEERDVPLLLFLWQWKLVTTAAITEKFFSQRAAITAHKRLWQLENGKFIKAYSIHHDGRQFVWGLDRKGFHVIRDLLPPLRSEGYKSEHLNHDFLVLPFTLAIS